MDKRLQAIKRRNPAKEKDGLILLPASNGKPTRSVNEDNHVKLASSQIPWYPIFRAKKHDPL